MQKLGFKMRNDLSYVPMFPTNDLRQEDNHNFHTSWPTLRDSKILANIGIVTWP